MIVCHLLQRPSGPETSVIYSPQNFFEVVVRVSVLESIVIYAAESCWSVQVIQTRTLLPPRSFRVLIRFSAAALRQVVAVVSEPHRFPSEYAS